MLESSVWEVKCLSLGVVPKRNSKCNGPYFFFFFTCMCDQRREPHLIDIFGKA